MKGFINFIRKQGVVGLAVGFILGGAVSKLVSAVVQDIINPVINVVIGGTEAFADFVIKIGPAEILLGHFIGVVIDFLVIALVVYYGIKGLKLDRLDKKE
jgi:large conductance mechanosensitive channel